MNEEELLKKAMSNVAMNNLMSELREAIAMGPKVLGDIYSEYLKLLDEQAKEQE